MELDFIARHWGNGKNYGGKMRPLDRPDLSTYTLIPNVTTWYDQSHEKLPHSYEVLAGDGQFRTLKATIGKSQAATCTLSAYLEKNAELSMRSFIA